MQRGIEHADVSSETTAGLFLQVRPDSKLTFALMEEPDKWVSGLVHEFWGRKPAIFSICTQMPDCPGCALNNRPIFRAYIAAVVKGDDGEKSPKIVVLRKTAWNQLREQAQVYEEFGIKGRMAQLTRVGSTKDNTRYTLVLTPKTVDDIEDHKMPDVWESIGPKDRAGIEAHYAASGMSAAVSQVAEANKEDSWETI